MTNERLETCPVCGFAIIEAKGEIDRLRAELGEAKKPNQRLMDLVRHQRMELLNAGLITEDEYTEIAQDHVAVARLEDYDQVRARLSAREVECARLMGEGHKFLVRAEKAEAALRE